MTSRESAIFVSVLFTHLLPRHLLCKASLGRRIHCQGACSELSEPSISQGVEKSGKGESACFVGFCACFLEMDFAAIAEDINILRFCFLLNLLVVVFPKQAPRVTSGR
jgi:hypothetical protein